jgi:hypothetical protein
MPGNAHEFPIGRIERGATQAQRFIEQEHATRPVQHGGSIQCRTGGAAAEPEQAHRTLGKDGVEHQEF